MLVFHNFIFLIQMNSSSSDFLRFDTTDIGDPLLLKNLKEINETPEIRTKCLEILRKDLKNLKDIEPCSDEDFLLRFLRVSKYDPSKAFQRIMNYYKQADVFLDIFSKITFPLHEAETMRHLTLSPYRCRDNSFLLLGKGDTDYKRFSFGQRFYLEILVLHTLIENPVNQICGGTYLFDFEGLGINGYLAFTPFWLRLFVKSFLNTLPCRMKAVHVVNAPSFFPFILKICYRFMSKKMQNRVFFHTKKGDLKDLHAHIPPEILPEKYGGKLKQEEIIDCMDNLKEKETKILKIFSFGTIKKKKARQSFNFFQ